MRTNITFRNCTICRNSIQNPKIRVHYQLSEDGGKDGAAKFSINFSTGVPLQQGPKYSFDTSQELIHICWLSRMK